MDIPEHHLHHLLDRQQSTLSNRLIHLHSHKDRFRKSSLPSAIALYNNSLLSNRYYLYTAEVCTDITIIIIIIIMIIIDHIDLSYKTS